MGYRRQMAPAACVALGLATLASGCVSPGGPAPGRPDTPAAKRPAPAGGFPTISVDTTVYGTLGPAIRYIGETYGGGAVLLGGLEDWPAPSNLRLSHASYTEGIERLVAERDCKVQVTPYYVFIYPPGYEQLEALSLAHQVDPQFDDKVASFAIGSGTDLYNALALLSESLHTTLIADNAVADAWCGEVSIQDAPLSAILEALLKSARIPASTVEIESTAEYILVRSVENANREAPCLNCGELTAAQRQMLGGTKTLRVPGANSGMVFQAGAVPLSATLQNMSEQLGVNVTAEASMADLPVNVAVFSGVSVQTALDLIVWQWPVPDYGYRVEDGGIRLCARGR